MLCGQVRLDFVGPATITYMISSWMYTELTTAVNSGLGAGPIPNCVRVTQWPSNQISRLNAEFTVRRGQTVHRIDVQIEPLGDSNYLLTIGEVPSGRLMWEAFGTIAIQSGGFLLDIYRRADRTVTCPAGTP